MPLPNTYKTTIEIPESEALSKKGIRNNLYNQLTNNHLLSEQKKEDGLISFQLKALFNIKYPVEISIEKKGNYHICYEIKLIKLTQLSIALVIFIAFFSSFQIEGFLWFSAIFTLIFFFANAAFANNGMRKIVYASSYFKHSNTINDGNLSKEQQEWMKNPNKCPACGEDLSIYEKDCPECGLKLPWQAKEKPFDTSKYQNKRLTYSYKSTKPKK